MRKRPPHAERLVLRAFLVAAGLRHTCDDGLGDGEAGAEEASRVGDRGAPFNGVGLAILLFDAAWAAGAHGSEATSLRWLESSMGAADAVAASTRARKWMFWSILEGVAVTLISKETSSWAFVRIVIDKENESRGHGILLKFSPIQVITAPANATRLSPTFIMIDRGSDQSVLVYTPMVQ
ncbi:hypothetical protein BDP67DRAFT_485978 [Colletotrichum lupini]|nr:hypothetical protein BDP67DRAFT_485978 [Colletotrichum lupini]